jgi:hypothetical protein
MKFSPNNFLTELKNIVPGGLRQNPTAPLPGDGGFNQDYNLGLNGGVFSGSAALSTVNNVPIITSAASQTTVATYGFLVPRDYDENSDQIRVRILARMGGATNTPTLTVASSTTLLGGTVGVAGTSVTSAALSNVEAAYEFDLSGQGLTRDEILSFVITAGAHTTDALQIFAIEIVYASCIVSWKDGLDALGNPLR